MLRQLLLLIFILTPCYAETVIIEPDMGRTPVLSALHNAKKSIDMIMYGFTDDTFAKELMNAKNQNKNVRVLIEKSPYKSEGENNRVIHQLKSSDINLNWPNPTFQLTHQKTIIIDNKTALIMTFNLTHSSFSRERNFALIVDDPAMVTEIENVFLADWHRKNISVNNSHLVWSPNNSKEKLIALINNAKSTIQIYAQDLSDYDTIGALAHAARNKIKVEILTSAAPSSRNKRKYAYLQHAGVEIHLLEKYYVHAKLIIIDKHTALLGSMNLTKPSITNNRELSAITDNPKTLSKLEEVFTSDWLQSSTIN